jgi:hypothetical protein
MARNNTNSTPEVPAQSAPAEIATLNLGRRWFRKGARPDLKSFGLSETRLAAAQGAGYRIVIRPVVDTIAVRSAVDGSFAAGDIITVWTVVGRRA